jgi:RNA polymerase sigma-54 factor
MAIKLSQNLKQSQNLIMTPQLQQSIKMLALSHMEITDLISNELIENPLLEDIKTSGVEPTKGEDEVYNSSLEKDAKESDPSKLLESNILEKNAETFDWQGYLESSEDNRGSAAVSRDKEEFFNYENIISKGDTLAEHLRWQLRMEDISEKDWDIADFIIGNINDDGYLAIPFEEVVAEFKITPEYGISILEKIQKLDPIGCGSRDLKDCLLAQAKIMEVKSPLLEKIINNHLKDLENKNYEIIAKTCGNSVEEVMQVMEVLSQFYPKPGLLIAPTETQFTIPDVFVYEIAGEYRVKVNDEGIPKLRISKNYLKLIKTVSKSESERELKARNYIKEKFKNAEWFINSINKRQKSIFLVTEAIVKFQQDFFKKGPEYLKPLTLKVIAEEVGVHESTVSRVTSNKYLQCPRGVYELKFFFKSGIGAHDGHDVSSDVLKIKIKSLIDMESKKRPFSDQKLSELLKREGISVARRTIAKYREDLAIPSSTDRKIVKN